jgi:hypothetical protein
MYASGSTWLFNSLRKLAETVAPELPVESRFVAYAHDVGNPPPPGRLLLVKSHETDEAAEAALAAAADLVVVSIRDPFDVVASVMQYQRKSFADALDLTAKSALQCERLAGDKRAVLLRYEAGFVDDPATLDRLAASLGAGLAAEQRQALFEATRRHVIERHIAGMARKPGVLINKESGDLLDPGTHWHSHHANRTGEVGRWRRALSGSQIAEVREALAPWLARNFYAVERAA